jgi:hypothetical protein
LFDIYEKSSAEIQKLREALGLLAIRVANAEIRQEDRGREKMALRTRMLMEHCGDNCSAPEGVDCRDCEEFGEFLEELEIKAYERDLEERAEVK